MKKDFGPLFLPLSGDTMHLQYGGEAYIEPLDLEVSDSEIKVSTFKVYQKQVNRNLKSSINTGGFFKGEGSYSDIEFDYLAALFTDKYQNVNGTENSIIYVSRHGFGFRVRLKVTNIQGKINLNFASIAASADMKLANVSYRIDVYGVPEGEIIKYLPLVGEDFNSNTFSKIVKAAISIKKHISKNLNKVKFFPIEVLAAVPITNSGYEDSISFYFAAKKLAQGKNLNNLIREIKEKEKYSDLIAQYIYSYFKVQNAYSSPNNIQKKNAQKWLDGNRIYTSEHHPESSWVSISPELDEDGAFRVFSFINESSRIKPTPLKKNFHEDGFATYIDHTFTSMSGSSSFKIAAIGGVDNSYNSKTITYDVARYQDHFSTEPIDGLIYGTRYGVGVRLTMYITSIEFGVDINFGSIAAAAELGLADIEYEITGIGISDHEMFSFLPEPQDINLKNFSKIIKAMGDIKNKISKDEPKNYNMQPFMVLVKEPLIIDPLSKHQHLIFCYKSIAKKLTVEKAVSEGISLGLDRKLIEEIYKDEFEILTQNQRPSNTTRREARDWLELN